MLGGALITFGLPFIFNWTGGDGRALYGQYYDISNTLSIFSMVLIGGLLPTFSRFVAHQGNDEHKPVGQLILLTRAERSRLRGGD